MLPWWLYKQLFFNNYPSRRNADYSIEQDGPLNNLPCAEDAPFNAYNNQNERTCLDGTCKEVLGKIYEWADEQDERRLFWLNGLAGTGKSTIARTVARRFHTENRLGASFFFSRHGGDVGTSRKFVTTISRQLASWSSSLGKYICESFQQQREIATKTLSDQWNELVLRPLSKVNSRECPFPFIVVVDALDECDSEADIATILRLLAGARLAESVRLRIFMTGRPEIPVQGAFRSIAMDERDALVLHHISPAILDQDIRLLLESDLRDIAEKRGLDTGWPGEETIKRLARNASGLVIWADTACRFICDGKKYAERRLAMMLQTDRSGTAPERRLDEIYLTVLKQSIAPSFTDEEKEDLYRTLRHILGSIVVLFSSLSTESLGGLLNVPKNDVDQTLLDLHAILDIPESHRHPLRLHHPSFRNFLLRRERCDDLRFWVDEKQMHGSLAMRCINAMSSPSPLKRNIYDVSSPGMLATDLGSSQIEQRLPPDVQYACLYWVQHLRESGNQVYDEGEVHQFLQVHLLHWLEALSWMQRVSEGILAITDLESISRLVSLYSGSS